MGVLDIVPVRTRLPRSRLDPSALTHLPFRLQPGVLTGDNVRKLFEYAKEHEVRLLSLLCSFIASNRYSSFLVRYPCKFVADTELAPDFTRDVTDTACT